MTTTKDTKEKTAQAAAKRKLDMIVEAVEELKALNVEVLAVREQTSIADYFVICTGTSDTHIKSIAEHVQDELREKGRMRAKPEGAGASFWLVLDYGDVILHIFDEETREFYDLEHLWTETAELVPEEGETVEDETAKE